MELMTVVAPTKVEEWPAAAGPVTHQAGHDGPRSHPKCWLRKVLSRGTGMAPEACLGFGADRLEVGTAKQVHDRRVRP